ncbi:choice-of-anchor A domain-containing protein [Streptomyces sp. 1114.5]|uniref:choice-of-anchor A family protein n=1 Tax=Streptomyces sp. 1114.5 TaxID=1938830 RepID=UPI000EB0C5A6|nr:choice-of-anchor A family protein [Streptomyces sp. 1114.5]RKT11081.1 choice-of-anchor A domain-containing protein [Streptomyces sp. 1114.5]
MRISTSAAALAVGGSLALAGLVAPAAQAVGADQECRGLGVANLYGEFIEGDDTHTPDAEGAVAVGGNADFTGGFSVGQELTPAEVDALPGKNALVVAGRITGHNTQVMKGNGVYGSKADGAVVQAHAGTVSQGASPIDFKAEFAKLRAAATSLAAVPQTVGATVQAQGPKLTFTGGDAKYNSFTVDAATLQGAKEVYLKVPAGAVTVVNVTGGSYDMAAAGTSGFFLWDAGKSAFVLDDKAQSASGGAIRARLLWNFPTATKVVKKSDAAWAGTVLAPNAAFDLGSGGPVNGSVIAASLTGKGGAETHHYPFTGCLPGTVVPTPNPTPTGTPTVPPVVTPSGSPSVTPSGSASPSVTPSGKPSASGSASPSASASASTTAPVASGSASPSATANGGGNLAHTGSGPVVPLAVGGAVVIAAGGGIVVAARRKAAKKA